MSYVLRIWEQPASIPLPSSLEDAERVLHQLRDIRPGRNPKFTLFAQRLAEGYPGMIKATDGFDEADPEAENFFLANLPWRGEEPDGDSNEAVYSLGLTTALLEKERPFAIEAAKAIGLCVADDLAGEVFLPDGTRLSADEPRHPAAPDRSATPRPDIYRSASSHVLQVWEQPESTAYPRRFGDVIGLVDQLRVSSTGQNPKFILLAQRLLHSFPPVDSDKGSGVWNGLPPDGKSEYGVLDLDVRAAKVSEVRSALIRHARQLGLSFLDELAVEAHFGNGSELCERSITSARVSPQERFQALSLLAARGNPRAQAALGADYEDGHGVRRNYHTAMNWYRLAANQGLMEAQNSLGLMYKRGHGASQDYPEAAHWFRLAAQQGMPEAQANLGTLFQCGHGVAKDEAEAAKWFRSAAKQGNAHAACALGFLYLNGMGVPEDEKQAIELFRVAARKGDKLALMNLGAAYDSGCGVGRNRIVARALFNLGSADGNSPERLPNGKSLPALPSADLEEARELELAWAKQPDIVAAVDDYLARKSTRSNLSEEPGGVAQSITIGRIAVLSAVVLFMVELVLPTSVRIFVYALGVVTGIFGVAKITQGMEAGNASRVIYTVAMLIPLANILASLYLTKLASNALSDASEAS